MPFDTAPQPFRTQLWYAYHRDSAPRLDYHLCPEAVVFDIGGYEGDWADDIWHKFSCTVHIFEVVQQFARNIEKRFLNNPHIKVHNFGLGGRTRKCLLSVQADGSSVFKEGEEREEVLIIEAAEFFRNNGISHVDLMKINIEGSEYELTEHLIETNLISAIDDIQIQFHDFVPHASERMEQIHKRLRNTHYVTYLYEFLWENWRKRTVPETLSACQLKLGRLYEEMDFIGKELLLHQRDLVRARMDIERLKDQLRETEVKLEATRGQLGSTSGELEDTKRELRKTQDSLAIARELPSIKVWLRNVRRILNMRLQR